MTSDQYWKLIGLIDQKSLKRGDEDGALQPLQDALTHLSDDELFLFDNELAKSLYALDGRSFHDESGESQGSDDAFLYVRCWVVAQGKQQYLETLKSPSRMPKSLDQWCESLLYVGRNAWAKNNNADASDYPHLAEPDFESGSNTSQW